MGAGHQAAPTCNPNKTSRTPQTDLLQTTTTARCFSLPPHTQERRWCITWSGAIGDDYSFETMAASDKGKVETKGRGNATATPQSCSSTTTSAWRTRRRDSSSAGLRSGSHHTRVTYAHASPWHVERPGTVRYSATRDSEQSAVPATFSPAMCCPSQQTCESREERASPAGSSFRRGRSGRACRARHSVRSSCPVRLVRAGVWAPSPGGSSRRSRL